MPDNESNWNEQTLIMTKCQAPVMLIWLKMKKEAQALRYDLWDFATSKPRRQFLL